VTSISHIRRLPGTVRGEIDFYAGQDVVKDVSLRYATPEYTEGVRREEATAEIIVLPNGLETFESTQPFHTFT
jgi:hypothetical protein